jgi:hypothetical protein
MILTAFVLNEPQTVVELLENYEGDMTDELLVFLSRAYYKMNECNSNNTFQISID